MKTQYEQELDRRIQVLEKGYSDLRSKVTDIEKDDDFEQKVAAAKARLAELRDKGEDAWGSVKDKAEEAWRDLEGSFDDLKARFKK